MFEPNPKSMVVDDMMTMRKLVIKTLKELKFTDFIEAADGKLAWEALNAATPPPGLVISDWNMPNCSGLDFLKRVRGDSRFKTMPFILVTAEAEKTQVAEAVQAGVSNYVVKPFTPDILKEKLAAVYKRLYGG